METISERACERGKEREREDKVSDLYFEKYFLCRLREMPGYCTLCRGNGERHRSQNKEVKVKEIKKSVRISAYVTVIVVTLFYLDLPYCYWVFLLFLLLFRPSSSFALHCVLKRR